MPRVSINQQEIQDALLDDEAVTRAVEELARSLHPKPQNVGHDFLKSPNRWAGVDTSGLDKKKAAAHARIAEENRKRGV